MIASRKVHVRDWKATKNISKRHRSLLHFLPLQTIGCISLRRTILLNYSTQYPSQYPLCLVYSAPLAPLYCVFEASTARESARNTREVRFLSRFFFFFFVRLDMTTAAEETLCYQAIYWINSSHLNLKQSAIIMSSPAAQPLAHNSYNLTHLIPKPLMWKVTIAEYWSVSLCLLWE